MPSRSFPPSKTNAEQLQSVDIQNVAPSDNDVLVYSNSNTRWEPQQIEWRTQLSSSSGAFTDNSGSFVDVTNLSVSITTTGQPVRVSLVPDGSISTTEGRIGVTDTADDVSAIIRIVRDSTNIAQLNIQKQALELTGTNTYSIYVPCGCVQQTDSPAAGTYTYKIQVSNDGAGTVHVDRCKLLVETLAI